MAIVRATDTNEYQVLANGIPFQRDVATVRGHYVTGVPNGGWNMANYYLHAKTGTKLAGGAGGITIGPGIKKVLVSSATFIDVPGISGYLWYYIKKRSLDGTTEMFANFINHSAQPINFVSCAIPPTLVDVREGDLIFGYYDQTFNNGAGVNIRDGICTWLTVEVVEYE